MGKTAINIVRSEQVIELLLRQLESLGTPTAQPMFGGYGILVDGVLVALFRDGQFYVKPVRKVTLDPDSRFCPFPGQRLRLGFYLTSIEHDGWIENCRRALEEMRKLTARIPGPSPFRAYRLDDSTR